MGGMPGVLNGNVAIDIRPDIELSTTSSLESDTSSDYEIAFHEQCGASTAGKLLIDCKRYDTDSSGSQSPRRISDVEPLSPKTRLMMQTLQQFSDSNKLMTDYVRLKTDENKKLVDENKKLKKANEDLQKKPSSSLKRKVALATALPLIGAGIGTACFGEETTITVMTFGMVKDTSEMKSAMVNMVPSLATPLAGIWNSINVVSTNTAETNHLLGESTAILKDLNSTLGRYVDLQTQKEQEL